MKACLFIAAAFLAVTVTPLHAVTITVTTTNDNGPGSLRDALASAADGDTVDASGVFGTILLTNGELLVTNSVDIVGPGPDLLAVNGNPFFYGFQPSRVFHIGSNTVASISSLTITNGLTYFSSGGGIWNDHATLTVSNVVLSGNSALSPENVVLSGSLIITESDGGGIWNDHGNLIISACSLRDNQTDYGGGAIYNDGVGGTASVQIANSILSGNRGNGGGGINNQGELGGNATLQIVNSTLDNNLGYGYGGGIENVGYGGGVSVQIANSTLSRNSAFYGGGGIENYSGNSGLASATVANSALSSNSVSLHGGGIDNIGDGGTATVEIVDSTLSGNTASYFTYSGPSPGYGGGIYNSGADGGLASMDVANSTLNSNSAVTGGGIDSEAATLQIVNSTLNDNSATNGGSIYNASMAILEIGSTILSASSSGGNITNDSGAITSLGYNLSSDNGGGFLTATGDQTNTDPMLDPAGLQDNGGPTPTIALQCNSPAIDQGYNFSGAATDQRGPGFVRTFDDCAVPNAPGGDGTDIGAYEVQRGECPHALMLVCPSNLSVNARSPDGARVSYPTPVASNGCPISVTCTPPSGNLFAIGNTIVSCLATDSEGNEATCSFTVHVKGAAEQITDLISLVQRLKLKPWPSYFLTADLQSASNALGRDNTRAACGDLDVFIFEVDVETWWGQIWPPSDGSVLVRQALRIQNVLGCDDRFGPGHY